MTDTYPRQSARTRRYTLGQPQRFEVAADGSRVVFVRSKAGDDPVAALWVLDVEERRERVIFDPADAGSGTEGELTQEELDRRERAREILEGVTGFSIDRNATMAAFVLGSTLMVADLVAGGARELVGAAAGGFDPRIDPTGRRLAYVVHGALHVYDLEREDDRVLVSDEDPDVHWGLAEFAAAEEMERLRGFWWSPDGERLAVARVDERPVAVWHIADPVDPSREPRSVRYPAAGTANAIVTLHLLGLDGSRVDVDLDVDAYPYLVNVSWNEHGPLVAWIESRDQRDARVVAIDDESGGVKVLREDHDETWIHIVPGVPSWLPGGRLLHAADSDDTHRLEIDGSPVTPPGLHLDEVLSADEHVLFTATEDPTELHLWRLGADNALDRITTAPGIHAGAGDGGLVVVTSQSIDVPLPVSVASQDGAPVHSFQSLAEIPVIVPAPIAFSAGPREVRAMLFTPGGVEPDQPLPVLLDPYACPHFNRVLSASRMHLESQWFADQGFVVLVVDGRGTMFRGVEWEHAVHMDFAGPIVEDQVDALFAAAERFPFLDLSRVAMRGWSGGGWLTLHAVLRRPDVFHAGIAGAPVTHWRYYDTHYTERYVGMPDGEGGVYDRNSPLTDAPTLSRPLLLIHGLTDDNVYVANTLAFSKAAMEAGRPHSWLPLSGITHRPNDPAAAEHMLSLEIRFLRDALGLLD